MKSNNEAAKQPQGLTVFEKYLTLWVILCILGGIILGKLAPGVADQNWKQQIGIRGVSRIV